MRERRWGLIGMPPVPLGGEPDITRLTLGKRVCRSRKSSLADFGSFLTLICFATAGVSMNIAGTALVMAFTACLLPQLQAPDSTIPIDDVMGSWIASTPGISLLLGNGLLPSMMWHIGRKNSNLICIVLSIMGWVCICLAKNVIVILLGRTIQGVSLGMALSLGPILIAEYTTPRYRGAFLMTISLCNSIYVLFSHLFGSLFSWRTNAIICMAVTAVNLPIVVFSPESPTWLAEKGKYEECKKAFRWLRGDDEEEELKDIIKAGIICNKAKTDEVGDESFATDLRSKLSQLKATVSKKEFYKPIIIMVHVYAILHWAGINYLAMYNIPITDQVIGNKSSNAVHIAILDTQRLFSNILAVYIIKKVSRRGMLISLTSVNILALLGIAGYVYVKSRNLFESSFLGLALLHVHMFSVAVCTLPLPFIIAGEIFPLKYKGISGGISIVTYAFHFFLSVKTFPFLFKTIGLDGAYCLYALITGYSLWISYRILPETKDRTLLDIEKDFKGEDHTLSVEDLKSAQSLMA